MIAAEITKLMYDALQWSGMPIELGFDAPADDTKTGTISLLRYANLTYAKLVRKGFLQCFETIDILEGQKEYRFDGGFLSVYSFGLLDGDTDTGTEYFLDSKPITAMQTGRRTAYRDQRSRPTSYALLGSLLILDTYPDQDYTATMLADVEPTYMSITTDTPNRLSDSLHFVIASGGIYEVSRILMANPDLRTKENIIRHQEYKDEWLDGAKDIERVAHNRVVGSTIPANIVNTYDRQ